MIINNLFKFILAHLTLTLTIFQIHAAIIRSEGHNDIYGNLLSNNDATFPVSTCCVVPTCLSQNHCFKMVSCGNMCRSGKYPSAESSSSTPRYRLKDSYRQFDCRFGDCRDFDFTCYHCPDPRDRAFSIYLVREDCRKCYY